MIDGVEARADGPDEPGRSSTASASSSAPRSSEASLAGVGDVAGAASSSDSAESLRATLLRDEEDLAVPPPGVVHVRDELIGLSSLPTGASPSAHMVDPPVPLATARSAGEQAHHTLERRPVSRSVQVLSIAAAAVVGLGAVASVVLGASFVHRSDLPSFLFASAGVLVPVAVVAIVLLAMERGRLRRQLDDPVQRLRGVVATVRDGDLSARSDIDGPTDVDALAEEIDAAVGAVQVHVRRLRQHAEWGAQSRMIFEALDLAEDEAEAHEVADQALAIVDPDRSAELLLAPHGSTELTEVARNPSQPSPGCPVDEVSACVAIRRAQPVVFDSSESINSCPKLRGRPYGACSAVCVPVSVAGRPVGVLHTVAEDRRPPGERLVGQLATLSTQLGNRLGALRALETSRLEAATDKLTGLPNRRLLESQLASLIERSTPFVLVLADLDNFKRLNDSFGHEIGDRALQLFAQVLRDKVRGNDVIARLGGEEFVLVYPNMTVATSIEAVERVRDGLTQSLAVSTVPEFTCSFGITHSSVGRDADAILRVADAGLMRAKELGRDQVVYADETLAARIFGDGEDRRR